MEKISITFIPSLKAVLTHTKWRILQRIFWYCSARSFKTMPDRSAKKRIPGKIADWIRKNTQLSDHGFYQAIIEYEGTIKEVTKIVGQKPYK